MYLSLVQSYCGTLKTNLVYEKLASRIVPSALQYLVLWNYLKYPGRSFYNFQRTPSDYCATSTEDYSMDYLFTNYI